MSSPFHLTVQIRGDRSTGDFEQDIQFDGVTPLEAKLMLGRVLAQLEERAEQVVSRIPAEVRNVVRDVAAGAVDKIA